MHFPVDSNYIRLGLRAYFIVVLLFVAFVGDACCRSRTKLRLLKGEAVKVSHLTGWVRGLSSLDVVRRLRGLPNSWLGLLMLLTALLGIASDLSVSGFVYNWSYHGLCKFQQGLVLNATGDYYPSVFSAAYIWASNAQIRSYANGNIDDPNDFPAASDDIFGYIGIYQQVDNNTLFCAGVDDVVGRWRCSQTSDPVSYIDQTDESIVESLIEADSIYPYYQERALQARANDGTMYGLTKQLVVVSASSFDLGDTWDIKAALDLSDGSNPAEKEMQAYQCILEPWASQTDFLTGIVTSIDINYTLSTWIPSIQGALYDGFDSNSIENSPLPEWTLAWMLNSMIMVSGSLNSISRSGTSGYEGCLSEGTDVPTGLCILVLFIAGLAMCLTTYFIFLQIAVRLARRKYDRKNNGEHVSSRELCNNVPNGLLDWMTHAAHESNQTEVRPRHHHLHKWRLSTRFHVGRRMGVVPEDRSYSTVNSPEVRTPRSPSMQGLMSPTSTLYSPRAGHFEHKAEGTPVQVNTIDLT